MSKWTEVRIRNEDTGEDHSYGMLADKREVGPLLLYLTYDDQVEVTSEERGAWWLIVDDRERRSKRAIGFRAARKEEAWELFRDGSVDDIRESLAAVPMIGTYNPKSTIQN